MPTSEEPTWKWGWYSEYKPRFVNHTGSRPAVDREGVEDALAELRERPDRPSYRRVIPTIWERIMGDG